MDATQPAPPAAASVETLTKRAVLYLRVSTPRQMDTAIDIDPDGNSIATQRDVQRRPRRLEASSVKEFVEPGNSGPDDREAARLSAACSLPQRPPRNRLRDHLHALAGLPQLHRRRDHQAPAGPARRQAHLGQGRLRRGLRGRRHGSHHRHLQRDGSPPRTARTSRPSCATRHSTAARSAAPSSATSTSARNIEGRLFNSIGIDRGTGATDPPGLRAVCHRRVLDRRSLSCMADLGLTTRPLGALAARTARRPTTSCTRCCRTRTTRDGSL